MKTLLLVLLLCALALVGLAVWISVSANSRPADDAYALVSVEYGPVVESVSSTGVLQPRDLIVVGSNSQSGTVVEIMHDLYQDVYEGDSLVKLDDRLAVQQAEEARAAVASARENVTLAERKVSQAKTELKAAQYRVDTLQKVAINVRLEKELRAAEFDRDRADDAVRTAATGVNVALRVASQAEEALKRAELGVQLRTIVVPVVKRSWEGHKLPKSSETSEVSPAAFAAQKQKEKQKYKIVGRKVTLGQEITPLSAAPLFILAPGDLQRMEIHAQVAEGDINKVKKDQEVDFTVSAYSEADLHFKGMVAEVRQASNEHGAVFYEVIINVENQLDEVSREWRLRPFMTASVDIIRDRHQDTWKIPAAAVNLQLDEQQQTPAARAKHASLQDYPDRENWPHRLHSRADRKPWPLFVRIGGKNAQGQAAIKESQFFEVLDWDRELKPKPDPKIASSIPRVITAAPAPRKSGFFNLPTFKF